MSQHRAAHAAVTVSNPNAAVELRLTGTSGDVIRPLGFGRAVSSDHQFTGDDGYAVWARRADGTNAQSINEIGSYTEEGDFAVVIPNKVVLEVMARATFLLGVPLL